MPGGATYELRTTTYTRDNVIRATGCAAAAATVLARERRSVWMDAAWTDDDVLCDTEAEVAAAAAAATESSSAAADKTDPAGHSALAASSPPREMFRYPSVAAATRVKFTLL